MNKFQAMQVFVQVVDAGGFSRAADQLGLPKATVSSLVQQLEQSLQVKLLHRTTRQVNLTSDGAAYYERCIRILSDLRDAEESLSRTRSSPSGRLRVDVSTSMAQHLLIPALPDFFARYPDITLELGCSDRPVDLIEENVDCALRAADMADSTLIARRVGLLQFVTAATPAYLARHGHPAHPQDLTRHHCLCYFSHKTGKVRDWQFTRGTEKLQISPPWHLALNDSAAYLQAGLAGLGIMRLATYSALPLAHSGQIELLLPDWNSATLPVQVVYPQNRHLSVKVRVFVEWVADLFAARTELRPPPQEKS